MPSTRSGRSSSKKPSNKENQSSNKRARDPSEEKSFIVETILDKRKFDGIWKYKVKWEGYSEKDCTWEPAKNLKAVKELVDKFNEKLSEENEEEKTTKDKTSVTKGKVSKTKSTPEKQKNTDKGKKSSEKSMGSPIKKVKIDEYQKNTESVKKTNYGHFKLGDIPERILLAKKEKDELIFTIEWKPQGGRIPLNTEMTGLELRKYDKDLLLDFYEDRLKFIKPSKDSVRKSVAKSNQEEKRSTEEELRKENMEEEEQNNVEYGHEENNKNGGIETENITSTQLIDQDDKSEHDQATTSPQMQPKLENEAANKKLEQMQKAALDVENMIDNNGQSIFADLGFNVPDDLRNLALDEHLRIVTQGDGKPSTNPPDKADPEDLLLESPKEISDSRSPGRDTLDEY